MLYYDKRSWSRVPVSHIRRPSWGPIGSWAMDSNVYGKAKLPLLNPSGTSYPMEACRRSLTSSNGFFPSTRRTIQTNAMVFRIENSAHLQAPDLWQQVAGMTPAFSPENCWTLLAICLETRRCVWWRALRCGFVASNYGHKTRWLQRGQNTSGQPSAEASCIDCAFRHRGFQLLTLIDIIERGEGKSRRIGKRHCRMSDHLFTCLRRCLQARHWRLKHRVTEFAILQQSPLSAINIVPGCYRGTLLPMHFDNHDLWDKLSIDV